MGQPDIFQDVGGLGLYQKRQFVISCLVSFISTELFMVNFMGYTPDHWCHVQHSLNLSQAQIKSLTVPWDNATSQYR